MKKNLLFVHDHIFAKKNDLVYSAAAFPATSWDRYLEHFDTITVIARSAGETLDVSGLVRSSRDNVKFIFVDSVSSASFSALYARRRLRKLLENAIRFSDAVVVRLPSENGNIAADVTSKMKKPLAVEVVGCAWDAYWNYGSFIARLYASIAYLKMKRSVKQSDMALYVTSKFLQNRYPARPGCKTVSASNVVLGDDWIVKDAPKVVRLDGSGSYIVGLIGNFKTNYKGIDLAILCVSELRRKGFDVSLRVLGNGDSASYSPLCQNLGVQDFVEFSGCLPNGGAVVDWLDNADLYIQPSRQEGLPRSLIEAMSRGKTCFGSEVGGIPELLPPNCVHKKGDWRDLAERIANAFQRGEVVNFDINNWQNSKSYSFDLLAQKRSDFFSALHDGAKYD
jgi:glycosyltransferase involved in cell wall biosynthesis